MEVDTVTPDDWRAWRDLRLEALKDTPIGFMETYDQALTVSEEQWRERLGRPGLRLLAHDGSGPVGMAGGFRDDAGVPVLFAVYVTPAARRSGALEALVDAVAAWCAPDRLVLEVHVDNHRARRAYERLGFVLTGHVRTGAGIDGGDLLQMAR